MTVRPAAPRPSLSDRIGLIITIVLGAIGAVLIVISAARRVIEVLPNRNVPVTAAFLDSTAALPIGPNGAPVSANVENATFFVSDMAGITVFSLAAAPVVFALAALAVIACVCLLCANLIRGIAFSKTNTRLILTASFAVVIGWAGEGLFTTMGTNGAFAALSDHTYETIVGTYDFSVVAVALVLSAVGLAFQAGERLQREAEGLV